MNNENGRWVTLKNKVRLWISNDKTKIHEAFRKDNFKVQSSKEVAKAKTYEDFVKEDLQEIKGKEKIIKGKCGREKIIQNFDDILEPYEWHQFFDVDNHGRKKMKQGQKGTKIITDTKGNNKYLAIYEYHKIKPIIRKLYLINDDTLGTIAKEMINEWMRKNEYNEEYIDEIVKSLNG